MRCSLFALFLLLGPVGIAGQVDPCTPPILQCENLLPSKMDDTQTCGDIDNKTRAALQCFAQLGCEPPAGTWYYRCLQENATNYGPRMGCGNNASQRAVQCGDFSASPAFMLNFTCGASRAAQCLELRQDVACDATKMQPFMDCAHSCSGNLFTVGYFVEACIDAYKKNNCNLKPGSELFGLCVTPPDWGRPSMQAKTNATSGAVRLGRYRLAALALQAVALAALLG